MRQQMNQGAAPLFSARNIFLCFLLALIAEGAVRKWIAPGATNMFVAVRDFCALALITQAVRQQGFKKLGVLTEMAILWSAAVVVWGLIQLLILQTSPIIFLIGLRFWLLYAWMALAVGSLLSESDLNFIFGRLGYLLIIMTPLVVAQHLSPPGHIINLQPDTEEDKVFRVAGDIVRASGTFSFTLGFTCFLALVSPAVFQPQDASPQESGSNVLNLLLSICLLVSTVVSGSRAAVLLYVILFLLSAVLQFVRRAAIEENIAAAVKILSALAVVAILLTTMSQATEATLTRFEEASDAEVLSDRLIAIFAGEPEVRAAFNVIGSGIGAGTNAGGVLSTGDRTFQLAESEPGRISLEAGLLGYAYTGLKIIGVLAGLAFSCKILLLRGLLLPALMWITTGIGLLTWPISGQLSAHGFSFAMVGLSLALIAQPSYYTAANR